MIATRRHTPGITLVELIVVLAVMVVLAAMLVPLFTGTTDQVREDATRASLRELQPLIANRYVVDMRGMISSSSSQAVIDGLPGPHPDNLQPAARTQHPQLQFLFVNPNPTQLGFDPISARGWRGPYLLSGRGTYPDPTTTASRGFDDTYGMLGDPTVLDGWGNPIVIQGTSLLDSTLVSAGPDGSLLSVEDNIPGPDEPVVKLR